MKLLILPFAAALSGLAWFARGPSDEPRVTDDACGPCPTPVCPLGGDCKVDVDCTGDGTCVITCEAPSGERCVIEVACPAAGGEGECKVLRCDGAGCEGPRH